MIYIGDLVEQATSIHYKVMFTIILIIVILLIFVVMAFLSKKTIKKVACIVLIAVIGFLGTLAGFQSYSSRESLANSLWERINSESTHSYEVENLGQFTISLPSQIHSGGTFTTKTYKDGELTTLEFVFDGDKMYIYELVKKDFE